MKDKNNGHKKGVVASELGGNKDALLDEQAIDEFIHSDSSTDKAFKSQESLNPTHMIIMPDEEHMRNLMRYDLPNRRFTFLISRVRSKCAQHKYNLGVDWVDEYLGMMPSIRGKRVEILSETVIGERKWKQQQAGNSLIDKVKGFVGGDKPA